MERSWIIFLPSYYKCLYCNTETDLCQWFCGCSFTLGEKKKPKPELNVSGLVFIWLCILYVINAEGKLETSPLAFTECLSRLFTLLWKLMWMKSLYCSPVILRMDPKWKLRRSLPVISVSVGLVPQLTNTEEKNFNVQIFSVSFQGIKLSYICIRFLLGIKGYFFFLRVPVVWYKMLPLTTNLVLPEQHAIHLQFKDWQIHHCYRTMSRANNAVRKEFLRLQANDRKYKQAKRKFKTNSVQQTYVMFHLLYYVIFLPSHLYFSRLNNFMLLIKKIMVTVTNISGHLNIQ